MEKRILFAMILLLAGNLTVLAYTPVENVILKYSETKGARDFVARGNRMAIARGLLKNYPVAPIADRVDELAVLKMERASEQDRKDFLTELISVLEGYEYYGKYNSRAGVVDVYILRTGPETVSELVVYNPAIYSLNLLSGTFTVDSLLQLDSGSSTDTPE